MKSFLIKLKQEIIKNEEEGFRENFRNKTRNHKFKLKEFSFFRLFLFTLNLHNEMS